MLRVNSHCTDVGATQLAIGQYSCCSVQISKEKRALYSNLSSDTLTRWCFSMLFSFSYCMRDKWRGLIPRPHSCNPTEIGVLVYVLSQIRHAVCTILFLPVVASTYTINTIPFPHHNTHTHTHTPHTPTAYPSRLTVVLMTEIRIFTFPKLQSMIWMNSNPRGNVWKPAMWLWPPCDCHVINSDARPHKVFFLITCKAVWGMSECGLSANSVSREAETVHIM